MAKGKHVSETPATLLLKKQGVSYTEHVYEYVDHGGAKESARQLGLDIHQVAKTLIMEDENAQPLIVIMHGDREVSTKNRSPNRREADHALQAGGGATPYRLSSWRNLSVWHA